MDTQTLQVLTAYNPWLREPESARRPFEDHLPPRFIPRQVPGTQDWPRPGKAHLVIGARQVGKTTFLWKRLERAGLPPLHINAEEPALRSWCRSPSLFAQDVEGLASPATPILIDEAQHLDEAGLFLKGLVDLGLPNPLYVTGSSSYHLRSRTRESLAGRSARVQLHPFSLAEVSASHGSLPPILRKARAREDVLRQAVFGGYPEAWLSEHPADVLVRLREAFLIRDASDLYRVQNLDAFRRLLGLLAAQVGSLVNVSEWAGICGVSRPSIVSYLDALEESHVIRRVRPFVGGRRSELTRNPKTYFADNGLLSAAAGQFGSFPERLDRGPLLENWVAAELLKHLDPLDPTEELRFWRSKSGAEVDFVLTRPEGLTAIDVKASASRRRTLSRSAHSFIEAYQPTNFLVVHLGAKGEERVGASVVRWIGPEELTTSCFGQG